MRESRRQQTILTYIHNWFGPWILSIWKIYFRFWESWKAARESTWLLIIIRHNLISCSISILCNLRLSELLLNPETHLYSFWNSAYHIQLAQVPSVALTTSFGGVALLGDGALPGHGEYFKVSVPKQFLVIQYNDRRRHTCIISQRLWIWRLV